jgi:hypothetical protein
MWDVYIWNIDDNILAVPWIHHDAWTGKCKSSLAKHMSNLPCRCSSNHVLSN